MINKGFISSLMEDGTKAIVIPQEASQNVTFPLVIPYFLLECLAVNMPVVYATFPDQTGIILARMDGEWNHTIYRALTVEGTAHMTERLTADRGITATGGISAAGGGNVTGSITATGDVKSGSVSLQNHVHSGVMKGNDDTDAPK